MTHPDPLDPLERIIRAAIGLTAQALAETGPAADLTLPQWRALVIVAESSGGLSVGDVARRLSVSLPSASRLVRRLERHGLVATLRDDVDRRVTRVEVTGRGATAWRAVAERRRSVLRPLLPERASAVGLAAGLAAIASGLADYA